MSQPDFNYAREVCSQLDTLNLLGEHQEPSHNMKVVVAALAAAYAKGVRDAAEVVSNSGRMPSGSQHPGLVGVESDVLSLLLRKGGE